MNKLALSILLTGLIGFIALHGPEVRAENLSFIENDRIRLGVDLDLGGSITFLESKEKPGNLINSHDWGRQVQMSFYSGPVPFEPDGKKPSRTWAGLGWNPIQSGDYAGNRSKILEHVNDGGTLFVKCIPMQWPLDDVPGECTFESRIRLEENRVHVTARIDNARSDKTQFTGRGQELPAVYVNGPYHKIMSYTGSEPFTGGELERFTKIWRNEKIEEGFDPWSKWIATEGWAALVNDEDWGLGVWSPETLQFVGGFYQEPGVGGPKDPNTGYLAPVESDILDHNIGYEYEYVLIVDDLVGIRDWVARNHSGSRLPDHGFDEDREHFIYRDARDEGVPIEGELNPIAEGANPLLVGPNAFWKAEEAPTLFIRMATNGAAKRGRVVWKIFEDRQFSDSRSMEFDLIADGEFHTYPVDLSAHPEYRGAILGIGLYPGLDSADGDRFRIDFISHRDRADHD